MDGRQRSWGVAAIALVAVTVGGFAASAGGSRVLASPPSSTTVDTVASTVPTSSDPEASSTSTTTSTTLPLAGAVSQIAERQDPQTWVTAMPTFPPPPTTTLPPDPCASTDVPANSGSGRRAVYSKSCQRVWLVEEDGTVAKTHRVSGRQKWNQPTPNNPNNPVEPRFDFYNSSNVPAYYRVASRSYYTCNINKPYLCWNYMVRFTKGGDDGDSIGFHQIPVDTRTNRPVQTLSQLGQPLSGGCIRQAPDDAKYVWNWAPIGTKVVVLP